MTNFYVPRCNHDNDFVFSFLVFGKKSNKMLEIKIYAGGTSSIPPAKAFLIEAAKGDFSLDVMKGIGNNLSKKLSFQGVSINWPDRKAPFLDREDWLSIIEEIKTKASEESITSVYARCVGGHGRTGTILTILLGLFFKGEKKGEINHIRNIYCVNAVESYEQEVYVAQILRKEVWEILGFKSKEEMLSIEKEAKIKTEEKTQLDYWLDKQNL